MTPLKNVSIAMALLATTVTGAGATSAGCSSHKGGPQSYDFTTSASRRLESSSVTPGGGGAPVSMSTVNGVGLRGASVRPLNAFDDHNLCNSVVCFTPEKLTGKYFAVGLSIQSDGHGMMAFFGQDSWSAIGSASPQYDFDVTTPITQSGNLVCCSGAGNLKAQNTYIESIAYLFAYLDATFTIPDAAGAHGQALGTHTVRFIVADDAVPTARRGDLQYRDVDGTFKWMDSASGSLSASRPSAPVTMPAPVVSWTNPFGPQAGNQSIPVFYEQVNPPSTGGIYRVTEEQLRTPGHAYAFDFGARNFVMFPRLLRASGDIGRLDSVKAILENVITQGLPDGMHPGGAAGTSTLYLDGTDVGINPEGNAGSQADAGIRAPEPDAAAAAGD